MKLKIFEFERSGGKLKTSEPKFQRNARNNSRQLILINERVWVKISENRRAISKVKLTRERNGVFFFKPRRQNEKESASEK